VEIVGIKVVEVFGDKVQVLITRRHLDGEDTTESVSMPEAELQSHIAVWAGR
jgi:hypothetical protein